MSAKGIITTVLATGLAEAVLKDEAPEQGGFDLSAGLFGTHVSAWVRGIADDFVSETTPGTLPVTDNNITDYWYDHYRKNGHCSLCGGSGRLNTTGVRTAAGLECGSENFCICPNGQAWRRGSTPNPVAPTNPVLGLAGYTPDGKRVIKAVPRVNGAFPVPYGVYYSPDTDMFYLEQSNRPMSMVFRRMWHERRGEFPDARGVLTAPEQPLDALRMDWLEAAAENGCVTMCLEMDGGVHLTLDGVGDPQEAYRNQNSIREAIDAARARAAAAANTQVIS